MTAAMTAAMRLLSIEELFRAVAVAEVNADKKEDEGVLLQQSQARAVVLLYFGINSSNPRIIPVPIAPLPLDSRQVFLICAYGV